MEIALTLITLLSLTAAATMSLVTWHVLREERRRSEARVTQLAAEIRSVDADLPLTADVESPPAGMFSVVHPVAALPRLGAVVLAGALVVGTGAALLFALGKGGDGTVDPSPRSGAARSQGVAVRPAVGPLELVALGHERDRDQLTVRGIVRNPAGGLPVSQLEAVVLLYDRSGVFLTTGRAAVLPPSLESGSETTFLVTVRGAADVGRYRVSFRSEDRTISHVDIRK